MCPFTNGGGWRNLPQCSHGLKKVKRKRDTEKDPHHRVSRSVGTEWKRDTSHTEEENRRSVCQQVLKAFREGVRERWRERESEQLLIWTHRPSPVSAHSNVCPARLTRPRVAPITHNPALPTASARHTFEGFTEQILTVIHIEVEPSPCVVRLHFMARTKKKEPSSDPPINELSSHLVTRHLKSHIEFERFLYRKRKKTGRKRNCSSRLECSPVWWDVADSGLKRIMLWGQPNTAEENVKYKLEKHKKGRVSKTPNDWWCTGVVHKGVTRLCIH